MHSFIHDCGTQTFDPTNVGKTWYSFYQRARVQLACPGSLSLNFHTVKKYDLWYIYGTIKDGEKSHYIRSWRTFHYISHCILTSPAAFDISASTTFQFVVGIRHINEDLSILILYIVPMSISPTIFQD